MSINVIEVKYMPRFFKLIQINTEHTVKAIQTWMSIFPQFIVFQFTLEFDFLGKQYT